HQRHHGRRHGDQHTAYEPALAPGQARPGGDRLAVSRRERQPQSPEPANDTGWKGTSGRPTSSWISAWGASGIARGLFVHRLPSTIAVTGPWAPATASEPSGGRHSSKNSPSV